MKKIFLLTLIVLTYLIGTSQKIPEGYYDNAMGLGGETLKNALYNIIKGHIKYEYTADTTDVWDILKETDRDPENPNNVILLYTGWSVDAEQEYNSGSGWSREHVWPQSRGGFNTDQTIGTDVHHLRPADISVNSARSNRWFSACATPYLDGGTEYTGCFSCSDPNVWQPRDEVKGDVARMIFYMATRYEGENGELDLEIVDFFPPDNSTDPIFAHLDDLIQWHLEDPVSDWERNRNDIIYNDYQHNRNPFIDHPEWVECIWANECGGPWFTTIPVVEATDREPYSYSISAEGSYDLELTISDETAVLPAWLSFTSNSSEINNATASLTGSPTLDDIGIYPISLKISDGTNETFQNFNIEVTDGNPIAFTSTPITSVVAEFLYTYNITASGDDGAVFSLTATTLPSWLTLSANTIPAILSGTPALEDVGLNNVVLTLTDDITKKTITQNFDINVIHPDNVNKVIISQYYEGAGVNYNKFLEITNMGDNTVDLSSYYLGRWSGTDAPSGNFTNGDQLSGNIASGETFVYKSDGATIPAYAVALAIGNTEATFYNGDDPVALTRNGTTWEDRVDCIYASVAGGVKWGESISFYRKTNVILGNKNMSILDGSGEWIEVSTEDVDNADENTPEYLGYHIENSIGVNTLNNNFTIYPNPTKNILFIKTDIKIEKWEIINTIGQTVKQANASSNSININSLKEGLYFMKITDFSNNTYFSKFIKE